MLILGTQSKRRIQILSEFSIPFEIVVGSFHEESGPETLAPRDYVITIAQGKGEEIQRLRPNDPILTLDTTVYFQGRFLNKPKDFDGALAMLNALQGQTHQVWTGVSLKYKEKSFSDAAMTKVTFHPLSTDRLSHYIHTYNPFDKAGAYAIQDTSGLLVAAIDGDFFNVVGFPVALVQKLLYKIDIDLWHYVQPKPSSSLCY